MRTTQSKILSVISVCFGRRCHALGTALEFAIILSLLYQNALGLDGIKGKRRSRAAPAYVAPSLTLIDANNLTSWVSSDANFPNMPDGFNGSFPKGISAGFVYSEGIMWSGLVGDGTFLRVRVGGTVYIFGLQAGRILADADGKVIGAEAPSDTNVNRVWRVRPDYKIADLTDDAAAYFQEDPDSVSQRQIGQLRSQYEKDWSEWPADKGAPFVDVNGDGKYEPETDTPGIDGAAQTLWLVANDLTPNVFQVYGSPSIGMEEQITEWAWHDSSYSELDNVIYKQVKLIYKGTPTAAAGSHVDSMYIAQWSDVDDGYYGTTLLVVIRR